VGQIYSGVDIYLSVIDPSGAVSATRAVVLAPPFTRRERFGLHVALLHPDQGERTEAAGVAFGGW
jgi:hypothetical protein